MTSRLIKRDSFSRYWSKRSLDNAGFPVFTAPARIVERGEYNRDISILLSKIFSSDFLLMLFCQGGGNISTGNNAVAEF